jgi:kynurenine formamidase
VHKILLAKPVLIIENLTHLEKLAGVDSFEVFALPMKLEADAAPARVVARW